MKMSILIATSGRTDLLERTLQSLAECHRPDALRSVRVIENGSEPQAQAICERDYQGLPVDYQWCAKHGKNAALNQGLAQLDDDELVVLNDNDILYCADYLTAYAAAAATEPNGRFFGGPFQVNYDSEPESWLIPYLPLSARGWQASENRPFDPRRTWFLGFNWAAFAKDLRSLGGFDESQGPGSSSNGTGDEVVMQKRLWAKGLLGHYVSDAMVWHYVPASRCSPAWVLDRARRDGIARAQWVHQQGGVRKALGHAQHAVRWITATSKLKWNEQNLESPLMFRSAYQRQKAEGYFSTFYRQAG